MPASYSDVVFAKLALQQRLIVPEHLHECLSAQEAGRRAGVAQTIGQVLVKRGYLSHRVMHQLEMARELAERSRCAKLSIQLLLRHGRPGEHVLREYYQRLKGAGFPMTLGNALQSEGHLTAQETDALDEALKRAWAALYHRETRELQEALEQGIRQNSVTRQTGAYEALPSPYGGAALHNQYVSTELRPAYGHDNPPGAPPWTPPQYPPTGHGPPAYPYGPPGMGPRQLPPSPSPWRATAERGAYPHEMTPPPHMRQTMERVAHMNLLPEWARTRMREAYQDVPPGVEAPPPPEATPPPPAPAPRRKRRANKLQEPSAHVPGYEYLERLGRGTVGVVYKAKEEKTGRIVALKILLPIFMENATLMERFEREASIARQLDHPNIRKVFAGGQAGGLLYLAMEYVDGDTVQDRIDRQGKIEEEDCLRWTAQMARAMDHYNRRDILHRDVKPGNILIARDGRALLCDLGISKRIYEDYALTKQGTTLGSPWYLSPEQGMGTGDLDIRSDIYSLGITVFHGLTGRVPFLGGNAGVIISKHARDPLPDMRKLNPSLAPQSVELVQKMCAKEPASRHQRPRELLAEIAWIRTEVCGSVQTPIRSLDPPELEDEEVEKTQPTASLMRRLLRALGLR
ncbi:serine/threonine-protein kinase [Planctomycetota bacterium]